MATFKDSKIDAISIMHSDRVIEVRFSDHSNFVKYRDDQAEAKANATQIKVISAQHKRLPIANFFYGTTPRRFATAAALLVTSAAIFTRSAIVNGSLFGDIHSHTVGENLAMVAIGLICTGIYVSFLFGGRPWESRLFTRTKADLPSFWRRKRDDLLIGAVSLIVGGIIGYWVNTFS
ncbi:hypothetical protein [Amycolatopsis rifamycinica]|uniref:hypothetical protein n=1 Tax=Amycolatopsis rifamycinica TaxID=287986 RepID=UPI00126A4B2F|nr:hypothetical protein [Amycolatopsis rifamycinica]